MCIQEKSPSLQLENDKAFPVEKPIHDHLLAVLDCYVLSNGYILLLWAVGSLADIADSTHSTLHHLLCSHVFYSTEKEKKYRSDGIPFPVQLSYRSFLSMHGWQKNKAFRNNSSTNSIRCPSQQELTAANLQSSTVVPLQKAFRDCDNDVKSHLLRLANPHVPY